MDRMHAIDRRVSTFFRRWGIPALRISLAIVFIWFGALKIFGVTPVTDLVAETVYWFDPDWVVPVLDPAPSVPVPPQHMPCTLPIEGWCQGSHTFVFTP